LQQGRQMLGREVRLTEEDQDERVGMLLAESAILSRRAGRGLQSCAGLRGHAIEPIDIGAEIARGGQQFVKWSPVVTPVEFEAYALPQFVFFNFALDPFVEDVLVAGKNGLDAQHYRALVKFVVVKERGDIALRIGQGMIVADQNSTSFRNLAAHVAGGSTRW